jgi:hypothetical protein
MEAHTKGMQRAKFKCVIATLVQKQVILKAEE